MKVLNVTEVTEHFVETDQEEFDGYYRRSKRGDWEVRMGESWEPHYNSEEIEAAFQEFIKHNEDR